ncbi:MAG: hypothetical protein KF805_14715 [Phycisphaeraceae bacterium]|nr:hypothetical protein [Phycisphaeraceae bacterium]
MRATVCVLIVSVLPAACVSNDERSTPSSTSGSRPPAQFVSIPVVDLARVHECRIERSRSGGKTDTFVVLPSKLHDTIAVLLHTYRGWGFQKTVPLAGGFSSFVETLSEGTKEFFARLPDEGIAAESITTLSIEFVCDQVRSSVAVTCSRESLLARIEASPSLRKAFDLVGSQMGKDYRIWDEPGPDKDMINLHCHAADFQPGSAR